MSSQYHSESVHHSYEVETKRWNHNTTYMSQKTEGYIWNLSETVIGVLSKDSKKKKKKPHTYWRTLLVNPLLTVELLWLRRLSTRVLSSVNKSINNRENDLKTSKGVYLRHVQNNQDME